MCIGIFGILNLLDSLASDILRIFSLSWNQIITSVTASVWHAEISLEFSEDDVGVGAILGGVNSHIKAFVVHPLKDQRSLLIEGP